MEVRELYCCHPQFQCLRVYTCLTILVSQFVLRRLAYRRCKVVGAVVDQAMNGEIVFNFGHDGATAAILDLGDDDEASVPFDPKKVSLYYTVTLTRVLDRLDAPTVIDYLCLDVEGTEDSQSIVIGTHGGGCISLCCSCRISGVEFYSLRHFAFNRYVFKILTIERPKADLIDLLTRKGYKQLCTISRFGETLWVSKEASTDYGFDNTA
jgi:hypothetical protein